MNEIFAALPALLREYSDSDEIGRAVVFGMWRQTAGDRLGEHTVPLELDGDRLVIDVPDRSWQRNLESLAPEMIFRLNARAGHQLVRFIEFRVDREALKPDRDRRSGAQSFEADAMDEIDEPLRRAADRIADDAMRRAFLFAAGSCLAREKRLMNAR